MFKTQILDGTSPRYIVLLRNSSLALMEPLRGKDCPKQNLWD